MRDVANGKINHEALFSLKGDACNGVWSYENSRVESKTLSCNWRLSILCLDRPQEKYVPAHPFRFFSIGITAVLLNLESLPGGIIYVLTACLQAPGILSSFS